MKSPNEIRKHLFEKAGSDQEFRSRLVSDPRSTIERELNLKIPEGLKFQIHEDSEETAHLVLPHNPQLTETQLSQVAGGRKPLNATY